ncbi:MAG: hypothetical protein ABWZ15_17770, partial [Acidimicrobiia bacterium]
MPATVVPFPSPNEPWLVHEHPDRALDEWARLCACNVCTAALIERGRREPRAIIAIRTESDRLVVTSDLLAEALQADSSLASLLYVESDRVRELYVPVGAAPLPSPQRWWSATCAADDQHAGRPATRYRVPRRESWARRKARSSESTAPAAPFDSAPRIEFVPLVGAVRAARTKYRELVAAAAAWALGERRALSLDVLAMILDATETRHDDSRSPVRWSRTGVTAVLSVHVLNWCTVNRVHLPARVPETLWTYLDFLFETGRIDPESDPLGELRKPLCCYCGLDEQGVPARDEGAPRAPCECHVVYRGPDAGQSSPLRVDGVDGTL